MRISTLALLSFLTLPLPACAQETPAVPASSQGAAVHQQDSKNTVPITEDYICPMHKDVHGKKGDVCPICGMPLVLAHSHDEKETPIPQSDEQSGGNP